MKKIDLQDCLYQTELPNHESIKEVLLSLIEKDVAPSYSRTPEYMDSISKVDWATADNFNREWVKLFLPNFDMVLSEVYADSAYAQMSVKQVWYQQYLQNDEHNWHLHGEHMTGVYYLELGDDSSRTELMCPLNNSFQTVDVKEGDIILFPAHIVHRGMLNQGSRKTIVSFNYSYSDKINTPFVLASYESVHSKA